MGARHVCCTRMCVGFRAIMGICEWWVQVIDAGTLETGRQSDWPSASIKRGEERKGEEEKIRGHRNSMATIGSGEKCIERMLK